MTSAVLVSLGGGCRAVSVGHLDTHLAQRSWGERVLITRLQRNIAANTRGDCRFRKLIETPAVVDSREILPISQGHLSFLNHRLSFWRTYLDSTGSPQFARMLSVAAGVVLGELAESSLFWGFKRKLVFLPFAEGSSVCGDRPARGMFSKKTPGRTHFSENHPGDFSIFQDQILALGQYL